MRTRVWADCEAGRIGLKNLLWEPTAAGNGGEEWRAETRLMRLIHEFISTLDLRRRPLLLDPQTHTHRNTHPLMLCCDLRGLKEENPQVSRLQAEDMWPLGVVGCLLSQRVMHAHHLLVSHLIAPVIILTYTKRGNGSIIIIKYTQFNSYMT